MLLDRSQEQAILYELLDSARRGRSTTLVISGAAGIGKSRLLQLAIQSAADMEVSRVSGVESEMGLSYAGLHRLLSPFIDEIDSLPIPKSMRCASFSVCLKATLPTIFWSVWPRSRC